MTWRETHEIAHRLAADLAEFSSTAQAVSSDVVLDPDDDLIGIYDGRLLDEDLREATRSRFVSLHYADAVESGVKCLNEVVRARSGCIEDGDGLMTKVFSVHSPILRINRLRNQSEISEQRGHMQLCQGVVAAWRNPRAHSLLDDEPMRAIMMLETIQDLIVVTKAATRTRKRAAS